MKDQEPSIKQRLENIVQQTGNIVDTGFKLVQIQVTEKVSLAASNTIIIIALLFLVNFFVVFIFLGVAIWIGQLMDDIKMGFFITGGFYLLLIFLIIILRKSVIIPWFTNIIIKKMHDEQ